MFKTRGSKLVILSIVVIAISIGSIVLARSNAYENALLFDQVLRKVREEYVDRVDLEKLMAGAIRGMLNTLDPHTTFLSTKQYDDLMVSTHGSFGGLGIEIDIRNDWLTVIAPIEGTPAHRMGLRGGDRIVKIEDKSTRGITMTEAIEKLRGPKGTQVTITIQREGEPELVDYTITRDIIKIKSVPFAGMLDDELGYVRIAAFADDTGKELRDALQDLRSRGMEKLIVDLRRNTGGLLTQAIEVTEQFIEPGQTVVSTRGRRQEQNRDYKAGARAKGGDYPLVVLVDNQSASASEIVAGAIQDLDRGLVVGLTSFGKGTVQSVMRLSGGNALKITTAKYYTPSGRNINKDDDPTDASAILLPEGAESDSGRVYYTAAGRMVYGGGGIHPDIEVEPGDIPKIASTIARQGLIFEYAVHYVAANNGEVSKDFADAPGFVDDFRSFLDEKELEYTDEEFEEGIDFVLVMLRAEIARKVWGDDAAYMISMERDSQLRKVIEIVNGAKTLPDLFASAAQYSQKADE
jgi:carboxyl-terminal processing protease